MIVLSKAEDIRKLQRKNLEERDSREIEAIMECIHKATHSSNQFINFPDVTPTNKTRLIEAGYKLTYYSGNQREPGYYVISWAK
jgi:hypothetical protein|nr:MAG TPA: hypothetical protein [Caudoviricetes sp.]